MLNTLSHQQLEQSCDFYQCPAEHWLQLIAEYILAMIYEERSFLFKIV
ncbi:unnamed protein product [Staurois parvus]|uniref:Uncharacterized protein n=1 Tax=Staurois parvus TaxID=386267 RepID=A0ABN9EKL4_9NEOB|nr:unnamed protein product [Staurois parvus]